MSKFLINLIIRFGKSESVRKGLLLMLKSAAEKSDNDVDDAIVKMIEEKIISSQMKDIIDALSNSYSLEGEFEVQKSVKFIANMEDIELLKPYAIKLLHTNAKQAHFISTSIEVISQQGLICIN